MEHLIPRRTFEYPSESIAYFLHPLPCDAAYIRPSRRRLRICCIIEGKPELGKGRDGGEGREERSWKGSCAPCEEGESRPQCGETRNVVVPLCMHSMCMILMNGM
jgi:hypothetical protein